MKLVKEVSVTELFKQFCKERHAEDKGRNHDVLQEIYAKTELFDLSFLPKDLSSLSNIIDTINTTFKDNLTTVTATHEVFKNVSLPFENQFIKIGVAKDDINALFVREYEPSILTGTIYTVTPKGFVINTPFTIDTNIGKLSFDLKGDLDYFNFIMEKKDRTEENEWKFIRGIGKVVLGLLLFTLNAICNLPKHSVATDTPKRADYYTRKHGSTIKVVKPIYYVLDKKEEKNPVSFKRIRPLGNCCFDHSFRVIGHWRRINPKTYGKNRNGEYIVTGMTWVKEHMRGEGDLIKKIRVVK